MKNSPFLSCGGWNNDAANAFASERLHGRAGGDLSAGGKQTNE